jgi:peptidyl-tRNA hydrolase, PTH1 family
MSKFLIVGLGNIGAEYANTRHNIGFDIADALATKHGGSFKSARLADTSTVSIKGKEILIIKPTTYMNLSGRAVKYWIDQKKISVHQSLTILDDLALPLSKLRLRPSGSSAGHNGLKSIEEELQTVDYPKLRFGIGNDFAKGRQVDFVLGKWTEEELPLVKLKIQASVEAIETFIFTGIERTMTDLNKKDFKL